MLGGLGAERHTHHDNLGAGGAKPSHLPQSPGDPMNEDAREVPPARYLLQQRIPLEGQHSDLAQDLAGWPPPHWEAAAGKGAPGSRHPRAEAWVSPGSPSSPKHSGILPRPQTG